ncbi:hypothetical protein ACFLYN_00115 [Chloroflexota bacterium]
MESNKQPIIANQYFSYVSAECQRLFDNEYYYGCIALSQSLAEAYARFMYEQYANEKPEKWFYENITKHREYEVKPDVTELLTELYEQRNTFHHLKPDVPREFVKLKSIATKKIELLNKVETQVFEIIDLTPGNMKFKYPKYWETDKVDSLYLKID